MLILSDFYSITYSTAVLLWISVRSEMDPKKPIVRRCINCAWRSMRSAYCSMRESDSNRWSLRIGT